MDLPAFVEKWKKNHGGEERSNKDSFLNELCDAIGVARPDAKTGDREADAYVFEADVLHVNDGGKVSTLKVDLYKRGCFILEAKQGSNPGAPKVGCGKRESPAWHKALAEAKGQAIGYARSMDDPPPFIVVCDVGYVIELHADFDRTGIYQPFPNAQRNKIKITEIAAHVATLRALFLDPRALDPSQAKVRVTREVAEHIAELAKVLEKAGHSTQLVARFLMRCLFTMFAEDVELLPDKVFTKAIENRWLKDPKKFVAGVEALWRTMNDGGDLGLEGKILRFNGGLFTDSSALPLDKKGLTLLLEAARRDWSDVEPAIFGTLLERALDPKERHALGAHFTPRAYVERLVRPTIEEPLRKEWENAQAAAHKLSADGKPDEALKVVHRFHEKLCQTRVLDPACGSGNFLYVTLNLFKQIESEVLAHLVALGEKQEQLLRVTPKQFLGIEKKRWAKEIAELVLWIGYLQWHYRTHAQRVPPPEPVLQDFQNIECRDAVLAWDDIELVRDPKTGAPITRWDGETYKKSPVTGEDVPDETARMVEERYIKPRKTSWPTADYVVGNPPFVGNKRMRAALGDGYVEALRETHESVPETADYVMYWWNHAADLLRRHDIRRFGLITTNSIGQSQSRKVVAQHITATPPLSLVFAIPDHPWVDADSGAAVRIAMTVADAGRHQGTLVKVTREVESGEDAIVVETTTRVGELHADLTCGPAVVSAKKLEANAGLCFMGVTLVGEGFRLSREDLGSIGVRPDRLPAVVRPYLIGRDLAQHAGERYVIDFCGLTEDEARTKHPRLYQWVLDRVRDERQQNKRKAYRERWWVFGEPRETMRRAMKGLPRYIATGETARHKFFVFLPDSILPDHKLYAIASDDALHLGVLSSRVHLVWALAAGGRLGVGNDPTWTNGTCFLPMPFPVCTAAREQRIRDLGEQLDAHRKARQAAHPDLTITGMYNVLEKLRAGAPLTDKERDVHERGLVSILKKLHDDLDAAVFDAYGWPRDLTDEQILDGLVALNAERAAEEQGGLVRWLRPEFQNPTGKKPATQGSLPELGGEDEEPVPPSQVKPWPKKIAEQIAALRDRVATPGKVYSVATAAAAFKGAKKKDVEGLLDGLAALGVLTAFTTPDGRRWRAVGKASS